MNPIAKVSLRNTTSRKSEISTRQNLGIRSRFKYNLIMKEVLEQLIGNDLITPHSFRRVNSSVSKAKLSNPTETTPSPSRNGRMQSKRPAQRN